jgi:hypothetical protein
MVAVQSTCSAHAQLPESDLDRVEIAAWGSAVHLYGSGVAAMLQRQLEFSAAKVASVPETRRLLKSASTERERAMR